MSKIGINMKKYILTVLCSALFFLPSSAQQKKDGNTVLQNAEQLISQYRFIEAEELLNESIKKLKRRRQSTIAEEDLLHEISKLRSIMRATERLTIIDSIVVNKDTFLQSFRLSPESGTLHTYESFFHQPDTNQCTVYLSELGNKIYFSQPDENQILKLYTSDWVNKEWTATQQLEGLNEDDAQNFPFMLSDGITLYYAAQGEQTLGGYDIFVTRYDMDEKKFLYPENIGMPYNSPANDYMMVIDEYNKLGWFASDRNQPEGKVCIYIFIPNDIRKVYDTHIYPEEDLRRLALITCIAETWGDKGAVDEARNRLQEAMTREIVVKKKKDFDFVINDQLTYTVLADFRSAEAQNRMEKWLSRNAELNNQIRQLQMMRDCYSTSNEVQRRQWEKDIIQLEKTCENLRKELKQEAKEIRNMEIRQLNK